MCVSVSQRLRRGTHERVLWIGGCDYSGTRVVGSHARQPIVGGSNVLQPKFGDSHELEPMVGGSHELQNKVGGSHEL